MAMLLGKKMGMTRFYGPTGKMVPVTVLEAGPCVVTQVKTEKTDGYNAVQLGFDEVKTSRQTKPEVGHFRKAGTSPKRYVREMRLSKGAEPQVKLGDAITASVFTDKDVVDVISISKGKGYAGVMKRHHFGGFPGSHGTERKHRSSGSIASHATNRGNNGRPKKGKRMAGRMGSDQVTTKNHSLLVVDTEKNILVVSGSVAGADGSYCVIRTAKTPVKS